jgi:hypothetical protein
MKDSRLKLIIMLMIFVGLMAIGCIASVSPLLAQRQEIGISDLKRIPEKYINQKIVVKGTLRFIGRNYFRDPRFVIEDESGNQVAVTIWAPLEVPPPMPGREEPSENRPMVMRGYIGRKLSVTGIYRADVLKSAAAVAVGKGFIEVESVFEEEEK